jgi:putative ATPase
VSRPPLADRMRPRDLSEIAGQTRWLAPGAPLRRAIEEGRLRSIVLWGPPGCGKTTLARVLAHHADLAFVQMSAVLDGLKDLRAVVDRAAAERRMGGRGTLLFVDEIHRWNKAQQDALLPHVETGDLVLVGATTENPSFELNAALRSRLQVVRLEPIGEDDVVALLRRALTDPRGLTDRQVTVPDETLLAIARAAAGDARRALDDLERCVDAARDGETITVEHAQQVLQRSDVRHDKSGDDHFDVVSALIKSMRGSDPDAALYWLARMIAAGEDPVFIARRLVTFASEDVGNADPRALMVAVAASQAVQLVGFPEGRIPLAQAVVWLATCPKSNSSYVAIDAALEEVRRTGALPVPLHLRNAATREMKAEGYGRGYAYPHDHPHRIVEQQYLPDALEGRRWYTPSGMGDEKVIAERLAWWARKLGKPGS